MKRTVILQVDDETPPPGGNPEGHHMPEALEVWSYASGRTPKRMYEAEVPAGDQLTRDLDTLRRYIHQTVEIGGSEAGNWMRPVEPIPSGAEAWGAMNRITAAAGLDDHE